MSSQILPKKHMYQLNLSHDYMKHCRFYLIVQRLSYMSNFEISPIPQGTRSYGKYRISNPIFYSKFRLKFHETNTNRVYSFRSIQV
jgi:hypothetical protein